MNQFLWLLAGLVLGKLIVKVIPIFRMRLVWILSISLPLIAALIFCWYEFEQIPLKLPVQPDPFYLPDYYEYSELSFWDRLISGVKEAAMKYVYGVIGLGISLFVSGKEKVNKMKKAPLAEEPFK